MWSKKIKARRRIAQKQAKQPHTRPAEAQGTSQSILSFSSPSISIDIVLLSNTMVSLRKPAAIILSAWSAALVSPFIIICLQHHHATAFSPPASHPSTVHRLDPNYNLMRSTTTTVALHLSSSDIQAKLMEQMTKLQERDRSSREISPNVSGCKR